ncbi:NRDE family protein [Sedimenticola selenatireducens]|uniref:NRDE family protein n=1 Tax=Sedimenticola selenatireducens TaxID=191960 RepID=A0A557SMQ5_9GAMM|nr:NRDE family protein [Sedimenticola selenatireducens]TVO78696.1 NRDE family protein [Sedimenticola selenatireducens]TVT62058.1 MAG: NRDE family protein [Sedimenticola selenatireducens]
MCTLVILNRPGHRWPLLLAGNRDEMRDRPTSPPGRHWPDQPDVVAGLDHLGGGTWMGINQQGVVAVVMNREGALGPAADKKSRGELVLQALNFNASSEATNALQSINPDHYRGFNLFIGDKRSCYWIRNTDSDSTHKLACYKIDPGLHMLASRELDDLSHPRINRWLPHFVNAELPEPDNQQWESWRLLLAARTTPDSLDGHDAMNMDLPMGFGTVSSSLIAMPDSAERDSPVWLYADGAPDQVTFNAVNLES